jgi:predicted flap endonuclease-1-like 5' DNA nuclease
MAPSIKDIEGIGDAYKKKLNAVGIKTTGKLLEAGKTPKGRKELEEKTGIGHKLILEWVNLADLFRVKGVGEEYSDLLEEAGVDTVKELRNRKPDALWAKIKEVNDKKKLVRKLPSLKDVEKWVAHAKELPPVVEY